MKKVTALFLVLALTLALASCAATPDDDSSSQTSSGPESSRTESSSTPTPPTPSSSENSSIIQDDEYMAGLNTPDIINGKAIWGLNDVSHLKMSIEESDALFGTPVNLSTYLEYVDYGATYMVRTYENAVCEFVMPEENSGDSPFLRKLTVSAAGYTFCRDIKVGDSMESVLAKFPDENRAKYKNNGYDETYIKPLYGYVAHMNVYGCIVYQTENGAATEIKFSNSQKTVWMFFLYLDSSGRVSSMEFRY